MSNVSTNFLRPASVTWAYVSLLSEVGLCSSERSSKKTRIINAIARTAISYFILTYLAIKGIYDNWLGAGTKFGLAALCTFSDNFSGRQVTRNPRTNRLTHQKTFFGIDADDYTDEVKRHLSYCLEDLVTWMFWPAVLGAIAWNPGFILECDKSYTGFIENRFVKFPRLQEIAEQVE